MTGIDWIFLILYLIFATAIGFLFRGAAERSIENFFLSGRNFSWLFLGVSMVATTFAADTPLVVTGLVRKQGLAGNWIWWNMAIGWAIAVFFYAKLWRRSEIVTDAEFLSLRYSGPNVPLLRSFYALYNGFVINIIVSSWVIFAMTKIVQVITGWQSPATIVFILLIIAAFYSVASGFYAVVVTDLVQLFLALAGSLVLAYFSVEKVGGLEQLKIQLENPAILSFWPDFSAHGVLFTFIVFITVQWWAQRESSMPGYFAQRMFAARNAVDARRAALFFNFLHYAIRPWPWILGGLVSLVLYSPDLLQQKLPFFSPDAQGEASYALLIQEILPPGWKGFVFMSLAAAFMSTIDTQANWGASYIIRDLIEPFYAKRKLSIPIKKLIFYSRLSMIGIVFLSGMLSLFLNSVESAWKFIFAFTAGVGPVYLLRWYWRRINVETEIAAMAAGGMITIVMTFWNPFPESIAYPVQLLTSVLGSALVWLPVVFWGRKTDQVVLDNFFARVHGVAPACVEKNGLKLPDTFYRESVLFRWLQVLSLLISIALTLFGFRELFFGSSIWGWLSIGFASLFLALSFFDKEALSK